MCKYCKEEKKWSWAAYSEVRIVGKKLVVYTPEEDEINVDEYDIDFCPKCGEKLV